MGCGNCGSCDTADGVPVGCGNNGHCATGGCNKLNTYDWLSDICFVEEKAVPDTVEIRFKGTRKGFYRNPERLDLHIGDPVIVETTTHGYDLGFVSLTGPLVPLQMKKYGVEADHHKMLAIQRLAAEEELERWEKLKSQEMETMTTARKAASELGLSMKISDVEYQGDGNKAIFYYTADGRVDFRELIKVLARNFRVKVEMRQIGLRQEAGRLGGIGSCGRELCCSTWLTDFNSVPTTAARYQNLFLNPLKLSGQCGRLKCCLNYELDTYLEALEDFPRDNTVLHTKKGRATVMKTDILTRQMWFIIRNDDPASPNQIHTLSVENVQRVVEMNRQGEIPEDLEVYAVEEQAPNPEIEFKDVIGESKLERFDQRQQKSRKRQPSASKKGGSGKTASPKGKGAEPSGDKPQNEPEKPATGGVAGPGGPPEGKKPSGRSSRKPPRKPTGKGKSNSGEDLPKEKLQNPDPSAEQAGPKPESNNDNTSKKGRRSNRRRGKRPGNRDGNKPNPPKNES